MGNESRKHEIPFALLTRMEPLHQALVRNGYKSLDVSQALANGKFKIPNDNHDNEAANGVLAGGIGRFPQTSNLLPAQHWGARN
jgi:hypothetical protein